MRGQRRSLILATIVGLLFVVGPAHAQDGAVLADPEAVHIVGSLPGGTLSASLVLTVQDDVEGLMVIVSDLHDTTGSGVPRDPVPASAVTVTPAASWQQAAAGEALQVALGVSPPATTGEWSGTLTVRWRKPGPGQLRLPLTLTVRNQPGLALAAGESVKVAAMRGDLPTRTVMLQETAKGMPAGGLQAVGTDLTTADGGAVVPAAMVQASLPVTRVAGGGLLPLSLTFDLRDVASNDYSGNVLVTDEHHNRVTIPVQVTVKDRWPLPLAILVLGVALGLALTAYRTYGRPRDRLVVRIADIREQLREENHPLLTASVNKQLVLAEAAVAGKRWSEANTACAAAEALVTRWRQERLDWLWQAECRQKLVKRAKDLPTEVAKSAIAEALKLQLDQMDLEDYADAEAFERALAAIEAPLQNLEAMIGRWLDIRRTLNEALAAQQLPAGDEPAWRNRLEDLLRRLNALTPEQSADAQALADDIVTLGRDLAAASEQHAAVVRRRDNCLGGVDDLLAGPGLPDADAIRAAVSAAAEAARAQPDAAQAADWAENAWRGLWSARHILPLADGAADSVQPAAGALRQWLADAANYQQPRDAFHVALLEREIALRTALREVNAGVSWPLEPPLPVPSVRVKGLGAPADLGRLAAALTLAGLPRGEVVEAGCAFGLAAGLWRAVTARLRSITLRSRLRLWVFNATVYLVLVVALAWLGFNQLYVAAPTFGSSAAVDYFSLLMWGLGVDVITRAGVMETLKGLLTEA